MNDELKNGTNDASPADAGEKKVCVDKLKTVQKRLQKKDTQKFKSKYFEYYDDIKISDRQDW